MANILKYLYRPKSCKTENALDLQRCLFGDTRNIVIFDVGAYVGEITAAYKKAFPSSTVYSFEPFPESFRELCRRCGDLSIDAYNLAMSDEEANLKFYVNTDESCNSFFPRSERGRRYCPQRSKNVRTIEVRATTLDSFCDCKNISTIDILKLDVEGAETKVLKGASRKLSATQIELIYTEVMFVPHYEGGCIFHELAGFLEPYGYTLFNLYNLKRAKDGQLRWGDAIFLSPEARTRLNHIRSM
ncbi:MAG: FkbM family methyltransferase [Phycisphaerales bacterium]|nr:MAG: FkbM family methyltransferase [Phycisphaerales bacterium]